LSSEYDFIYTSICKPYNLSEMNAKEMTGNQHKHKVKLEQKIGFLKDNEPSLDEGKYEEILGKLHVKLDKTREELHRIITSL
jgi:uncharacterized protein YjbJ (UPF0337 family)